MKMPFGKYGPSSLNPKGVSLEFINSGYLKWLLEQDWFIMKDDALVLAVEHELKLREKDSSHFYQDKVRN